MTDVSDPNFDDYELLAHAQVTKEAWKQTLSEMEVMAAERADDGWTTVTIPAGDTATEPPEVGDSDRFGLVHVIPGNKADPFREAFDRGDFPADDVYRAETESRVFFVTALLDPDSETAIYVAGNFRQRDARPLVRAARDAGEMYTHVRKLDGTHLGSFEHDGYEQFFPEADRIAEDPGPTW